MRLSPLARLMLGLRKEERPGWESLVCVRETGMGWRELATLELAVFCWLAADDIDLFRFQQSGWSFFCSSARILAF